MSYKKVKLLKKQVSTDFGVTWVDVAPKVTKPSDVIVDTYDSYSECMYGISEEDITLPDFVNEFPGYKRIEWSDNFSILNVEYCEGCKNSCYAIGDEYNGTGYPVWTGNFDTATDIYVAYGDCITGITARSTTATTTMDRIDNLHIFLPDSLIEIGDGAFGSYSGSAKVITYSNINSLVIPESVQIIGNDSIRCKKLIMNGTTPPTLGSSNRFDAIYVPASSVQTYKTSPGWSNYSNKIYGY